MDLQILEFAIKENDMSIILHVLFNFIDLELDLVEGILKYEEEITSKNNIT